MLNLWRRRIRSDSSRSRIPYFFFEPPRELPADLLLPPELLELEELDRFEEIGPPEEREIELEEEAMLEPE
jgi:hypothetical protein